MAKPHKLPDSISAQRKNHPIRTALTAAFMTMLTTNGIFYGYNSIHTTPDIDHGVEQIEERYLGTKNRIVCGSFILHLFNRRAYTQDYPIVPFTHLAIPDDTIHLESELCDTLLSIDPTKEPDKAQVEALFVVSHEHQHAAGVYDEAEANCRALQTLPANLSRLGYSPQQMKEYGEGVITYVNSMVDRYRSPECKKGGAYDLGKSAIATNVWLAPMG